MSNIKEMNVLTLNDKIMNKEIFLLIDVREDKELAICKINQATHIPMNNIPNCLDQIDSNKPVIIMCKSGGRSAKICQYLQDCGYSNIYNLNGGIIKWALEIDPNMTIY